MAFQYWRQCDYSPAPKDQVPGPPRAYHGDTLGDVSVGDLARFHHLFSPLLFPTCECRARIAIAARLAWSARRARSTVSRNWKLWSRPTPIRWPRW